MTFNQAELFTAWILIKNIYRMIFNVAELSKDGLNYDFRLKYNF